MAISHFSFEGVALVLIASVSGHCIPYNVFIFLAVLRQYVLCDSLYCFFFGVSVCTVFTFYVSR